MVRYRFLFHQTYFVNQPAAVKRVLQENNRNYDRQLFDFQVLSNVLGNGLLTSDGEFWLRQRRSRSRRSTASASPPSAR